MDHLYLTERERSRLFLAALTALGVQDDPPSTPRDQMAHSYARAVSNPRGTMNFAFALAEAMRRHLDADEDWDGKRPCTFSLSDVTAAAGGDNRAARMAMGLIGAVRNQDRYGDDYILPGDGPAQPIRFPESLLADFFADQAALLRN